MKEAAVGANFRDVIPSNLKEQMAEVRPYSAERVVQEVPSERSRGLKLLLSVIVATGNLFPSKWPEEASLHISSLRQELLKGYPSSTSFRMSKKREGAMWKHHRLTGMSKNMRGQTEALALAQAAITEFLADSGTGW